MRDSNPYTGHCHPSVSHRKFPRHITSPFTRDINSDLYTFSYRYPRRYPNEELQLRVSEPQGLLDRDAKAIAKALHQAAASYAQQGEVCCFQLIQLCQELLQERNVPEEPSEGGPPPPESLWEQMQMRRREASAGGGGGGGELSHGLRGSAMDLTGAGFESFHWGDGGLFGETDMAFAAPGPAGGGGGAVGGNGGPPSPEKPPRPARPPLPPSVPSSRPTSVQEIAQIGAETLPERATANNKITTKEAVVGALGDITTTSVRPSKGQEKMANTPGNDGEDTSKSSSEQGTLKIGQAAPAVPAGEVASGQSFSTMVRSIGALGIAVLPKSLRRYLEPTIDSTGGKGEGDGSEAAGSGAGRVSAGEFETFSENAVDDADVNKSIIDDEAEREQLRRELLMGHLLSMATGGNAATLPPHALPAVTSMLQSLSLLPRWLAWSLSNQPSLFDRAFTRLFAEELAGHLGPYSTDADPTTAWAAERFWHRRALSGPGPGGLSHHHTRSGSQITSLSAAIAAAPDAAAAAAPQTSRYQADFTEVKQLGKGAYGVVVLAVNKFDGRQYAVKRVTLSQHSPSAFARIMREVATLSRLQHPSVVRYYQAWIETAPAGGKIGDENFLDGSSSSGEEDDSELDAWGSQSTGSQSDNSSENSGSQSDEEESTNSSKSEERDDSCTSSDGSSDGFEFREGSNSNSSEKEHGSSDYDETSGSGAAGSVSFSSRARASRIVGAANGPGRPRVHSSLKGGRKLAMEESTEEESGGGFWRQGGGGGTASGTTEEEMTNGSFTFDRTRPPLTGGTLTGTGTTVTGASTGTGTSHRREKGHHRHVSGSDRRKGSGSALASLNRPQKRILFIQMEYCRSTLRDILDAGPLEEAARWKVLRQLLSGLAHIHAQGIIHRDLKPANLFVDMRGDIKLGDFGLAKFTASTELRLPQVLEAAGAHATTMGAEDIAAGSTDATGVCGTHFYISPEIAQGSTNYDERVDIYSVGIIMFEVWHPFSTAMERVVLLRDLRERGTMPEAFEAKNPAAAALIRMLLAPDPQNRPTARQALRSELIPPTVGDEQLTDLLRSLPDNPAAQDRILEALFAPQRSASEATGAGAGISAGCPVPGPQHPEARERVLSALRSSFSRHGAVSMSSVEIGAATPQNPTTGAQILSPHGHRLELRCELRQPFAAWVVEQVASGSGAALLEGFRRYEISGVHRSAGAQGLPRSHIQADLDILTPGSSGYGAREPPVAESEVIAAVVDVLSEIAECNGRWEVRIGHRGLFEAVLAHAGVPKEMRVAALQLLRPSSAASPLHPNARQQRWPAARAALESLGLPRDSIARIKQLLLQAAGEAQAALHRLSTTLPQATSGSSRSGASGSVWLSDVQTALPLLTAWGVPAGRTIVDPLLPPLADYFTGLIFEVHIVHESTGSSTVIAAGGRYDALLRACWAQQAAVTGLVGPLPAAPLGGVGVTVNVERLIAVASAGMKMAPGGAGLGRLSASDVLVCSRGSGGRGGDDGGRLTERTSGRLMERARILRLLWDADIAAEMLPSAAPSLTDQFAYANTHGIPFLVIVNADEVACECYIHICTHINCFLISHKTALFF